MTKITKAVIPAAGYGKRLLPATKTVAKEMIPIINKQIIQYIVEEAINSGIKEILIIISHGKEAIKKHFEEVTFSKKCKIKYVYQPKMLGLGNAISYAKSFVGNDPFAVLLDDDVIVTNGKTALSQCIDAYNKTKTCIIGVQTVDKKLVSKYGIVSPQDSKQIFAIKDLVEKPTEKEAFSNVAILGRYILTPEIFKAIEKTKIDKTGEIQLTNALKILLKKQSIHACRFNGTRYDLGCQLGLVKATIDLALSDKELRKDILKHIKLKNINIKI